MPISLGGEEMRSELQSKQELELPKVSIIVPMYNVANFIKTCINSLLNQTYNNIEIILVDDGSTDQTLKISKEISEQDSRIVIVSQANNGANFARLTGFKSCSGSYITFVDADDWMHLEMIETMVKIAQKHQIDLVKCNYMWEDNKASTKVKNNLVANQVLEGEDINNYLFLQLVGSYNLNTSCGQLIRKNVVTEDMFEAIGSLSVAEDAYFNAMLLQRIKTFYFVPQHFYHYNRKNINSVTSHTDYPRVEKNVWDCFCANEKIYQIALLYGEKHSRWQVAKLIDEMAVSFERVLKLSLPNELSLKRQNFLENLLNEVFFLKIRKKYSFNEVCLSPRRRNISMLIFNNDIAALEKMFDIGSFEELEIDHKIKNPAISVIVCVYNGDNFLDRCLRSIVNQTFKNFELIVVNDASTDGTHKLIESYCKKYPNIKLVSHAQNQGVLRAIETGSKSFLGKYALFIDHDDWFEPQALELLFKKGEIDQVDWVEYDYYYQLPTRVIRQHAPKYPMWGKLFSGDFLRNFDFTDLPSISYAQDYLLYNLFMLDKPKTSHFNEALYNYFYTRSSLSKEINMKKARENIKLYHCLKRKFIEHQVLDRNWCEQYKKDMKNVFGVNSELQSFYQEVDEEVENYFRQQSKSN